MRCPIIILALSAFCFSRSLWGEPPVRFDVALDGREGYRVIADVLRVPAVRDRIEAAAPVTILAVPDAAMRRRGGDSDDRADFLFERLVISGRFESATWGGEDARWLLPIDGPGGFGEWAIRRDGPDRSPRLYNLDSDGLPRRAVEMVAVDLMTDVGVMHLMAEDPAAGRMARGGLLSRPRCRRMLDSALDRSMIYQSRDQTRRAENVLGRLLSDLALATLDTAKIHRSAIDSGMDPETFEKQMNMVPARIYDALNAGYVAGLQAGDDPFGRLRAYRDAIETARSMMSAEPDRSSASSGGEINLRRRLASYRGAVERARRSYRIRGLPDGTKSGGRDLFSLPEDAPDNPGSP